MKKITLLVASAFLFSVASCESSPTKEDEINEAMEMNAQEPEEEEAEQHAHSEEEEEELTLNEGKKWEVNAEMKPHIEHQEGLLKAFIEENDDDYLSLAEALKEHNAALIKSCTMEGKSHDELHKWLHPHIDLLGALGEADNIEKAENVIDDLSVSFETFHNYFE